MRNWRDRDNNGGGLIEFVRKGFIAKKKSKENETKFSETNSSEFAISNKKLFCLSVFRPPTWTNLDVFFLKIDKLSEQS